MFLLLAQGWIKKIVLQVYIIVILLLSSSFTPGGECQEESKEEEIQPLRDGEADLLVHTQPLHPPFAFVFMRKFPPSGLHEAAQLC